MVPLLSHCDHCSNSVYKGSFVKSHENVISMATVVSFYPLCIVLLEPTRLALVTALLVNPSLTELAINGKRGKTKHGQVEHNLNMHKTRITGYETGLMGEVDLFMNMF